MNERIPFEEAIAEPLLLKTSWDELSVPQKVILKGVYGLPLEPEEIPHWTILQGPLTYQHDGLGYPVSPVEPIPYTARRYDECWAILGRRSGKSFGYLAFVLAYEALLGGHSRYIGKRQKSRLFLVAQNLGLAQSIINEFVEPMISSTRLLEKQIVTSNNDGIVLKNRQVIAPAPPHIKPFRGYAIPVVAMDEVSFWYKDAESANPDYEVERAVSKAQAQFPDRLRVGASTPWSKEGMLYDAFRAGTCGSRLEAEDTEGKARFRNVLVVHAPTPAMAVPLAGMNRTYFQREHDRDPEGYRREFLGEFVDAVAGLFTESQIRDAQKEQPAAELGREALPRDGHPEDIRPYYVGAIDPAFRRDRFAFTIGHYEPDIGVVQDYLQWWVPERGVALNPAIILDEIRLVLERFKVSMVFSDQYQLEALQQLALDRGFSINGIDFTAKSKAKIYGNLLTLFRTDRIRLLRCEEQTQELLALERHNSAQGNVSISGRQGSHDDLATVLALMGKQVIWLMPRASVDQQRIDQSYSPSLHEKCMEQIGRKQRQRVMAEQRITRGYE